MVLVCLPFLVSAAFTTASNDGFARLTRSCGGLEYLIRISWIGGNGSSEWMARCLMTWLIRCRAGEKVSSIGAYSAGLLVPSAPFC